MSKVQSRTSKVRSRKSKVESPKSKVQSRKVQSRRSRVGSAESRRSRVGSPMSKVQSRKSRWRVRAHRRIPELSSCAGPDSYSPLPRSMQRRVLLLCAKPYVDRTHARYENDNQGTPNCLLDCHWHSHSSVSLGYSWQYELRNPESELQAYGPWAFDWFDFRLRSTLRLSTLDFDFGLDWTWTLDFGLSTSDRLSTLPNP